jgi:anti-sigma B factor antagonist
MPVSSTGPPSPSLTATQVRDLGVLTIRSQRDGDTHVIALAGELDLASVPDVEAELASIEGAARLATIVIDLRGVTFIDSSGLRLALEASRRAETAAYRVALLRPSDRVFRAFEISGIDTLLPFEPASAEAPSSP